MRSSRALRAKQRMSTRATFLHQNAWSTQFDVFQSIQHLRYDCIMRRLSFPALLSSLAPTPWPPTGAESTLTERVLQDVLNFLWPLCLSHAVPSLGLPFPTSLPGSSCFQSNRFWLKCSVSCGAYPAPTGAFCYSFPCATTELYSCHDWGPHGMERTLWLPAWLPDLL